ncbi:hypothetical protein ACNKTV_002787 [Vibrio parahaemolyticus]
MNKKTTAPRKAEVWIEIKRLVDGRMRHLELKEVLGERADDQVEGEMIQGILKQLAKLENTPQECSDPKDTFADCDLHETSPSVKAADGEVMELPSVPVRLLIWQQIASTANSRMSSLEKRTSLGARSFLQHEKEAELKVEKTLSEQITQLLTVLTEERPIQ